jgi:hypothetical protein
VAFSSVGSNTVKQQEGSVRRVPNIIEYQVAARCEDDLVGCISYLGWKSFLNVRPRAHNWLIHFYRDAYARHRPDTRKTVLYTW